MKGIHCRRLHGGDATPSSELRRDRGLLAGRHRTAWRHWREPYLFALSIPWPAVLTLIAGLYLAIKLVFARLYLLDPTGIGGTAGPWASFAKAFSSACRPCARSAAPVETPAPGRDKGVAFLLVWTAMHRLNASSPLHGARASDLSHSGFDMLLPL
jgi:hypothetical protein